MPCAQKVFFPFLEEKFPHLVKRYKERFAKSPYLRGPYQETIRDLVRAIHKRYGLASAPADYEPELWVSDEQLELFPVQRSVTTQP